MRTRPGNPYPLGATWDGSGVNFAIFSENATGIELCLMDADGATETARLPLTEQTDQFAASGCGHPTPFEEGRVSLAYQAIGAFGTCRRQGCKPFACNGRACRK